MTADDQTTVVVLMTGDANAGEFRAISVHASVKGAKAAAIACLKEAAESWIAFAAPMGPGWKPYSTGPSIESVKADLPNQTAQIETWDGLQFIELATVGPNLILQTIEVLP